ncbi:hypothetical protein [Saccharopolyspora sp. ASAGF58]|uniref:DUF6924 domain-containing protein n=1 Tax=Saccharopolyspora sp. ASAGF58 TaxID=2719023 RepID=UPI001446869D|nr:hypothetical protein [Saccharopolyspora sp. ASAGF58]
MRPPLPLPPDDGESRVPGILLVRTDSDDDVWEDVLWRMGELPGMYRSDQGDAADAVARESIPRRLIVAEDPAWRGATSEDVSAALERPGIWVPDLVVLTDDRTVRNADWRPLLAFCGSDGYAFWITPRQTAMTYLVLHRPNLDSTINHFTDTAPAEVEWLLAEDKERDEEDLCLDPVGVELESLKAPPRYTRPARELPPLIQENDLLVRTDFTDDAAWTSLVERVCRPGRGHNDVIDDFSDYVDFVDDPAFAGATPEQVMAEVRDSDTEEEEMISDVVLIADATTMREPGHRVLVVPLVDQVGFAFRVDPEVVGGMVVNLALGNMDIDDWRDDEA